jgi:hypothetical protein
MYEVQTTNALPTIIGGVLLLPGFPFTLHSSLFSPSGQKVLGLKPGANDVTRLAPGVYFVMAVGQGSSSLCVRKVAVLR